MPENAKKPQIRFKGFTDAWEQRKFYEIFEERHIISTISEEYPQLSFTISDGVIFPEDRKTNKRDFLIIDKATKKYLVTEYNDIIYNPANVIYGAIHRNSLRKGCVSPIYKIFFTKQNSKFMECIVRNENFINSISKSLEGTVTKLKTLKPESFLKMSSYISPIFNEQEKIGEFFSNIDNLITLHQRKLDKLKNIKKSMLEKMFPKNGSNVPEIRFTGFTDAWEQRKLGEIANIVGGGTPSTSISEYWNGDIDWYAPAEMEGKRYANGSAKKITKLGLQNCSAQILPAGRTILFTSRAGIGKMAILKRPGSTNQGFQSLVLNQEINPYFIYSLCDEIKEKAESVAAGSTFLEISGKALGNIEILMPKELEQNKVSNYFLKLDNLITLHQRKLEKLQNIKKACLEKMFV